MFQIIRLDTNEPLATFLFDGKTAAAEAKRLTVALGVKCQPRPMVLDDWKKREAERFISGEYVKVPWADAWWWLGSIGEIEHFAHVSLKDKGRIAFTESAEKGAADRQTVIKPGVYLQRYYSEALSTYDIQRLAREFAGMYEEHELLFAHTADEIERVYVNGPNSCMSHKPSDYASDIHPVRVYAAGDLALAYIAIDGEPTARALCWPERKVYGRVYGDADRLNPLLEKAGYSAGSLEGARLTRIEQHGSLVCPYIDHIYRVSDDGDCLRIGGDLMAESTNGLIDCEDIYHCEACGGRVDDDEAYCDDDGNIYCECCVDNRSFVCDCCGERHWHASGIEVDGGERVWCEGCVERRAFYCDHCEQYYSTRRNDAHNVQGETWCNDCTYNDAFLCRECGEYFPNSEKDGEVEECCTDCARLLADASQEPKPIPYHCDDSAQQSLPLQD